MRDRKGGGALLTGLSLAPAVAACVLLGAHFLRFYAMEIVVVCTLLPFVLLVRRRWAARLVQVVLLLGVLVWARAGYVFALQRIAAGEPWRRLVIIMGGVALFTLVAAALFETPALQRRYGLRTGELFSAAPPPPGSDSSQSLPRPRQRGGGGGQPDKGDYSGDGDGVAGDESVEHR